MKSINEIKDDLEEHDDGALEGFSGSYKGNPLNELDEKFYALCKAEPLDRLKITFVRENMREFAK